VLKARPIGEYRGVARFFAYLSRPEVQARWHQASGYLPVTRAAYELTRRQGFYEKNPGTDISIKQITLKEPTPNTKGLRLGSFVQVREVIEDELEQAITGKVAPKAALDSAVRRGNEILRRFEKANP
jgi:sn-glycerol 3-phosphate transport system substrate-binding protein